MSADIDTKAKALKLGTGHEGSPEADRQEKQGVALLTQEEEQYYVNCYREACKLANRAMDPYDPSNEAIAVILDKIAANLYWIRSGEVELPMTAPEPEPEQEQQEDPVEKEREETLGAGWNESRSHDVLWINDQKVHRRIFKNVRTGNIWERDIEYPSSSSKSEVKE